MYSGSIFSEDFEYHPILSDNFILSLGAFRTDETFKISAEGIIEDEIEGEIDFGNTVGVDKHSTLFNGGLRWKFGKTRKWSLFGQAFQADSTGEAFLKEDVEFQDIIFGEGSSVKAGVDIEVRRVFIGRSFVKNQQHDFGIGAGLHILDLAVFIEGDVKIDEVSSGFQRGEASASQPLPNVGVWYNFSPARKWLIHGRVDWISASVGDYDGTLWNTAVGVNYQAFRHVGFDLTYQFFKLDVGVDKTDWRGRVDLRYSGPILAATFNW